MVMTDPVADMLARIRNGAMAHKDEVVVPASKLKERRRGGESTPTRKRSPGCWAGWASLSCPLPVEC